MLQNRSQSRTIISTQRSRRSEEGVTGSIPVAPTTQSSRTAETVVDRKEAVSAGILSPIFHVPGLCSKKFRSWLEFRRLVRSLRGEQPVWSRWSPPSSLPEPRKPSSIEKRPFLRGSCHLFSTFPVSTDNNGLSGEFLASSLCIQKFRSPRPRFRDGTD